MDAYITQARKRYHKSLLESILSIDKKGVPSNADKTSKSSIAIAQGILSRLIVSVQIKEVAQTINTIFKELNSELLYQTCPKLQNFRPVLLKIVKIYNNKLKPSDFTQYEHLNYLIELAKANFELTTALGNDYILAPDIIIYRDPYDDKEINETEYLIDGTTNKEIRIHRSNYSKPILHTTISAKWTIHSGSAQNSRTEALNLIRNRKDHLPHIVVVTAEPLPSRLASLALGTGDIDCVYHFALYELIQSVEELQDEHATDMLNILIQGKRLKDISDLPLDLSV